MIIQCEQCSTRFRLADEKIKASGTKVRCSKCKNVFTVMPPASEPEEETIDFDAMNMEAVAESSQDSEFPSGQEASPDEDDRGEQESSEDGVSELTPGQAPEEEELDFSGLSQEISASAVDRRELAEDFSFTDPVINNEGLPNEPPGEEDLHPESSFSNLLKGDQSKAFTFNAAGETSLPEEPTSPDNEFSMGSDEDSEGFNFEAPPAAEAEAENFSFGEPDEAVALDFQDEPASDADPEAFDFDDSPASEATPEEFSLGETAGAAPPDFAGKPESDADSEQFGLEERITEFSFDDDSPSPKIPATEQWGGDTDSDNPFDFDEPAFEPAAPSVADKTRNNDDGLRFGEIDLTSESEEETPDYDIDEDFSGASLAREEPRQEETVSSSRQRESSSPMDLDDRPLPAPPIKRKSPLSKILLLLILLLLALGGAAAFFYVQDGSLDLTRIMQRFTGDTRPAELKQSINLKITESQYVKNIHVGQLLVVQGQAVNNFPAVRSAITVKGILLDSNGKILFQQTVSCGNPLDERTVKRMPFVKIEEAMNNQFGDSLSNMNVAPGSSIPFTIVFRNLPDGIANINVEVVSSKPGSN